MATKAKLAGASALAGVVTEADLSALVDGVATATLVPGADDVADPVIDAAPVWPRKVTLRNNSGIQLVEPITGKFLFAFSSEVAELHSQEQADAVVDNLLALASVNGLGNELTIEGLPV